MGKIPFVTDPVHSSTLLKLEAHLPASTVGNTLTIDKYLIQPHFKKPELSFNQACALHPAGYMLWWEVPGVEKSREERSLSNSTLQYQLTGLTSTTAYTLQVAALTAAGRGAVTSSTISTGVPPGTVNYTHSNTRRSR